MHAPRSVLIPLVGLSLVLAACGSPAPSASESTAPEENEAAASEAAETDGGGDGVFGTGSGSVQFEITGGFSDSGELPFAGDFAYFQQAGVSFLVFTDDTEATEANGVILSLSEDGNVFQYVTDEIVIPAGDCEWNIARNDASGAEGSFTCNDQGGFGTDGQVYTDLDIRGSFAVNI